MRILAASAKPSAAAGPARRQSQYHEKSMILIPTIMGDESSMCTRGLILLYSSSHTQSDTMTGGTDAPLTLPSARIYVRL